MHALMAAELPGMSGAEPPDGEPAELEQSIGAAKGAPLPERIATGKPRWRKRRSRAVKAGSWMFDPIASHRNRQREE
jgi:hypothetical protein